MPLYDFECSHGHRFDHQCKISERNEEIPCKGMVNQLVEVSEDFDQESMDIHMADMSLLLPDGMFWQEVVPDSGDYAIVREVPCVLKAKLVVTGSNLHHNWGANRDAAREGRYDPLNPSRRGLSGGMNLNRK